MMPLFLSFVKKFLSLVHSFSNLAALVNEDISVHGHLHAVASAATGDGVGECVAFGTGDSVDAVHESRYITSASVLGLRPVTPWWCPAVGTVLGDDFVELFGG